VTSIDPKPSKGTSLGGRLIRILIALAWFGRTQKPRVPHTPDELIQDWIRHQRKGRRVIR